MNSQNNQPDTKNFILAIVLSLGILFAFQTFWAGPQEKKMREEQKAKQTQQLANPAAPNNAVNALANENTPAAILSRDAALALTQRIPVDNGSIKGSISTYGARLDDVSLSQYRETTKKDSKNVTLLNPNGSKDGYYAFFGWTSASVAQDLLPGPKTLWKPLSNNPLTPTTPISLEYDNGQGLKFTRKIEVDGDFLFTFTDTITNNSAAKIDLNSYGAIRRHSAPAITTAGAFEGAVGILNNKLTRLKYRELEKGKTTETSAKGGWFGFSDGYWLVALIPDQKETIATTYKASGEKGSQVYETSFIGPAASIAPGQTITHSEKLYSGAKKVDKLRMYEKNLGLVKFDNAVDWGILWFLTKPFYWLLMFFTGHIGKIGLAMLAMTVVVKVVTFPLVYQSYKSFAKMRDLAPKMKEIQEKYPDDKARQQQETIKFYQTEKINPVAGCVPMLFQMPIFFALYKVLIVALEMRHAPFYGWITDLSAKDPTSFLNLFGLLPFDVASIPLIGTFLMIGAWPILYGASYWLLSKMQPTATDPMQAQIFAMMPWLFVIIFAGFSSGLVIYYTWSNLLTIVQQYAIAKSAGNSNPIDEFFARLSKKKSTPVSK